MEHLEKLMSEKKELNICSDDIQKVFNILKECYNNGGKLLVCGNGGSSADSGHIVGELMKGFMLRRPLDKKAVECISRATPAGMDSKAIYENLQGALPAISLSVHVDLITAFANDVKADMIFAQQVWGYGNSGDVFLGLSTSGNSLNVVNAAVVAKAKGLKTIAMTGETGGALKDICDVTIKVPSAVTPQIQEYHLPIYHTLCMMIETEFFGNDK